MTLLVTGGNGFVLSNLVRTWLDRVPDDRVVVLDRAPLDAMARRFFAPVAERITWVWGDVTDRRGWAAAMAQHGIDRIVHGATVTPHPYVTAQGRREPEHEAPREVLEVNLMGTVEMLEFAREIEGLRRFIYISTGSVYGDDGPALAGEPLPEDGYVDPKTLYGISKFASELVVQRYSELYDLPTVSVRLASVFGPMDRDTPVRHVRGVPNRVAHEALEGRTLKVHGLNGVGDWIHAADVADALSRLLDAKHLRYSVYNLAYGRAETLGTLIGYTAERLAFEIDEVPKAAASIVCDPDRRQGQWGAYDISRLRDEFGWQPAPLRQRMHEYIDWLRQEREEAGT